MIACLYFNLCINICLSSFSFLASPYPSFDHMDCLLTCTLVLLPSLHPPKLPFLHQWYNLHYLLLDPSSWALLENLNHLRKVILPEIHGFQPLLSSQPTRRSFYLSLVTTLSILIFLLLILRFDTKLNHNSVRDLTWAAVSVNMPFFPLSLFLYMFNF